MDWRQHIYTGPEILLGKPIVRGTRLSVDFILRLFAVGWTEKQVLENYPTLTPESLRAIFAFAAECMGEEAMSSGSLFPIRPGVSRGTGRTFAPIANCAPSHSGAQVHRD